MRAIEMDPVHDTRACFRALVEAMSRPGTVARSPIEPADHAVLATLVDHEVTLASPDETIRDALASEGRLDAAPVERADVVHAPDPGECPAEPLERGTLKEPSDGATVVYGAAALHADPGSLVAPGGDPDAPGVNPDAVPDVTLTLSGPGVPGRRTLGIDGWEREDAQALAGARESYPRGVDAVVTTGRSIAAIPRSVDVEVA